MLEEWHAYSDEQAAKVLEQIIENRRSDFRDDLVVSVN
jgi:hypothetical protein